MTPCVGTLVPKEEGPLWRLIRNELSHPSTPCSQQGGSQAPRWPARLPHLTCLSKAVPLVSGVKLVPELLKQLSLPLTCIN